MPVISVFFGIIIRMFYDEDRSIAVRCFMWDMNEVTKLEYRGGYVYYIQFDNGVEGELDFADYLSRGPVFEALKDRSLFSKAVVEGGTICWPNGADVAPETLYEKILNSNSLQQSPGKLRADDRVPVPE